MKTLRIVKYSLSLCFVLLLGLDQIQAQDKPFRLDSTKHKYPLEMTSLYGGLGALDIKDEYLSPLSYNGSNISFMSEHYAFARLPRMKIAERGLGKLLKIPFSFSTNPKFLKQSSYSIDFAQSQNPAGNGTMYLLAFRKDQSLMYRLMKKPFGQIHLGLGIKTDLAILYNTRNGNNPINIDASASLTARLHYAYRLPWRLCPMLIRLSSTTDLIGVRHIMDYGESYYQGYGKDFNLNKHLTFVSLKDQFVEQLRVSLDLPILNSLTLALSYRCNINNLSYNDRQRTYLNHSFFIGTTHYILPLSKRESVIKNPESLCF